MKTKLILAIAISSTLIPAGIRAEESAGGHYMPGAAASAVDALPGKTGFAAFNFFTYYNGTAGPSRSLAYGGRIALGVEATAYADTIGVVYQSDLSLLGGKYAAALAIPFMWMEVKAGTELTGPGGRTIARGVRDTASDIGDITFYPFMLGWKALGGDLKYDIRLGIYAPSGGFETGRLANTGKNYWTFEPGFSVSWLSSKIGTEVSVFAGFDFNTKNGATDYQTGTQFHVDATIEQHLPLFGGFVGVGANAFYYQQLTGDSGSGATLGSFKGHTAGIGPVVSYVHKIGGKDVAVEVKWLPELNTSNRTKGDFIWAKVGILF
ncbi:MAG: transporter [Verrucomicrobia bacterium]|nr:transporter [Verrucomicrobiota bacterium]